jgi:hypothetical protein
MLYRKHKEQWEQSVQIKYYKKLKIEKSKKSNLTKLGK